MSRLLRPAQYMYCFLDGVCARNGQLEAQNGQQQANSRCFANLNGGYGAKAYHASFSGRLLLFERLVSLIFTTGIYRG